MLYRDPAEAPKIQRDRSAVGYCMYVNGVSQNLRHRFGGPHGEYYNIVL